jgi:hypothetical protein
VVAVGTVLARRKAAAMTKTHAKASFIIHLADK